MAAHNLMSVQLLLLLLQLVVLSYQQMPAMTLPSRQPTGAPLITLDNCPNGVLVRKEYRDLSMDEWNRYVNAVLSLQQQPSPDGNSYSEYDYWTQIHITHMMQSHK